jgi:anti-sigma factor (TIGR02949 family)
MSESIMKCEQALQLLAAYLDRELDHPDQGELERHLEACRSCYSRLEFEKQLKSRLADLGHREPDPAFADRIRRAVRQFTRPAPQDPAA